MFKSFFKTKKWTAWAWGGSLVLLAGVGYQVHLTTKFNEFYGTFYTLLQQAGTIPYEEGLQQFWQEMLVFGKLAVPYIAVASASSWFARMFSLRWRESMTFSYLPRWIDTGATGQGHSQRLQQDCQQWAEILQSLGLQAVRSALTVTAFIPVLWGLGREITIPYFDVPGALVWIALMASVGGMAASWGASIKLPALEVGNEASESEFRKALVLMEDDRQRFTVKDIVGLFTGLRLNHQKLYLHTTYLDCWINFWDLGLNIMPYLVAGPALLRGSITLGVLQMISNSFDKVRQNLSFFVFNWAHVTKARAVYRRLNGFELALKKIETERSNNNNDTN